jgi:hypothetical protein
MVGEKVGRRVGKIWRYQKIVEKWWGNKGAGKTTYMFSANANVLSANFLFSVLPAGGAGMGQAAETESTLALA